MLAVIIVQKVGQKIAQTKSDRILEVISEKGEISNNDVQKIFGVSDATATRYLDKLEKADRIEQIGVIGRGVIYKIK